MLFSIIVPVYNVAQYLPGCMESLLAQDHPDHEIILVDDGSTDGQSGPLCDQYAAAHPALIQVIHQENGGLGAARNTGIAASRGEYLLFVDSDDTIAPHTLSTLARQIQNTHADLYCFGFQYEKDSVRFPGEASRLPTGVPLKLDTCPALLLESPSACFRAWRRGLFTETGIRFPGRVWYEDLRTTPKCLCHAESVVILPDPLYYYLLRDGSIMRNPNYRRNLEILDALEDVRTYLDQAGKLDACQTHLCYLAVDSVLMAAQRVLMTDPKAEILPEFLRYVQTTYPDYRSNPLLPQLGRKKRLVLKLLEGQHYRLLRTMFSFLHRLRGNSL